MKKLFFALVVLLGVVGCHQDPTAGFDIKDRPAKPVTHPPPYVLDVPPTLEFVEGVERVYDIFTLVPEPGIPVLEVEDLPEDAKYIEAEKKLKWKPSMQAANDPSDPNSTVKIYPVKFKLYDSANPRITVEKEVHFIVRENYDELTLKMTPLTTRLDEGRRYSFRVKIESLEFPNGPFEMYGIGLPKDMVIAKSSDPTVFEINYQPPHDVVKRSQVKKDFNSALVVRSPNDRTASVGRLWTLYNVNRYVEVTGPSQITQGPVVNFSVALEDPNGEGVPSLRWYVRPPFGKADIKEISRDTSGRLPRASFNIIWTEIPAKHFGKSHALTLNACADGSTCKRYRVSVKLEKSTYAQPVFDRSKWQSGVVKVAKAKQTLTVKIPVKDGKTGSPVTNVSVVPDSLSDQVIYTSGKVEVKLESSGLTQFTLRAESTLGAASEETFIVDVLDENHPEALVLGDSPTSQESLKNVKLFDTADLNNPIWQPLNEKRLAFRKQILAGTEIVSNKPMLEAFGNVKDDVESLIVMTPMLHKLSGDLKTEVESYGVQLKGRFLDQSGLPALKNFTVISAGDLSNPSKPIVLDQSLTPQSKSPMLLELQNQDSCKPLLNLFEPRSGSEELVAVKCTRSKGKTLIVSGIEWGDLLVQPADDGMAQTWMKEALQ